MLIENERVPVWILLLLLLLNALITLHGRSMNLELFEFTPRWYISKLLSPMVQNRSIILLIRYTYCHIRKVWWRHGTHTPVNCLYLLSIDKIDLEVIWVLVV